MDFENISLEEIVREAHESRLLKRYILGKLKNFEGISHGELKSICVMFGIYEEGVCEL